MAGSDPFPVRRFASLSYSHNSGLTSGAINTYGAESVFRLNSLFDPDFTGVGHQPYGFDQLSGLYAKYKVLRVTFRLIATTTSNLNNVTIGAVVQGPEQTSSLTGMSWGQVDEKNNGATRVLTLNDPSIIEASFPMQAIIGCTGTQFAADTSIYSASITGNPASVCWLRLAVASSSAAQGCTFQLRITYHCEFWDRISLGQS